MLRYECSNDTCPSEEVVWLGSEAGDRIDCDRCGWMMSAVYDGGDDVSLWPPEHGGEG